MALLQINPTVKNAFRRRPITAYKKNRNLKEIIQRSKILNKVIKKENRKG